MLVRLSFYTHTHIGNNLTIGILEIGPSKVVYISINFVNYSYPLLLKARAIIIFLSS
jgi:hypothetical protein